MRTIRGSLTAPLLAAVVLGACTHSSSRVAAPAPTGGQLFATNCARCHGAQAHGDGPAASTLSIPVPDLTHIAQRNGGQFPAQKVFRIIDGQWEIPAHGSRPMPIWGYEFYGSGGDDESEHREATDRIDSVVAYLASIQRP